MGHFGYLVGWFKREEVWLVKGNFLICWMILRMMNKEGEGGHIYMGGNS
jgi:hypothetical protein